MSDCFYIIQNDGDLSRYVKNTYDGPTTITVPCHRNKAFQFETLKEAKWHKEKNHLRGTRILRVSYGVRFCTGRALAQRFSTPEEARKYADKSWGYLPQVFRYTKVVG